LVKPSWETSIRARSLTLPPTANGGRQEHMGLHTITLCILRSFTNTMFAFYDKESGKNAELWQLKCCDLS
jgi:hypothetical protein